MKKGSKSFSLAALLFDRDSREGAELLYSWCRNVDDEIDNISDPALQLERLKLLRQKTAHAFADQPVNDPAFMAFRELCRRYAIDEAHAQALLEGMRMDVEGSHIRNDDDLVLYCYRVAGVVGLMMAQVMGVSDKKALKHAIDTGLAMQMSNIARDIREDFENKRIYIPDSWFSAHATRPALKSINAEPALTFNSRLFVPHVQTLLARAEDLYASGEQGLRYLPYRAALAVASAQAIYREIGRKVLARGCRAWDSRTVVSKPRKLWLMLGAVAKVTRGHLFGYPAIQPALEKI